MKKMPSAVEERETNAGQDQRPAYKVLVREAEGLGEIGQRRDDAAAGCQAHCEARGEDPYVRIQ